VGLLPLGREHFEVVDWIKPVRCETSLQKTLLICPRGGAACGGEEEVLEGKLISTI